MSAMSPDTPDPQEGGYLKKRAPWGTGGVGVVDLGCAADATIVSFSGLAAKAAERGEAVGQNPT